MKNEIDIVFAGGDVAWNIDRVHMSSGNIVKSTSPGGSVYYCAIGARAALKDVSIGTAATIGADFPLTLLTTRKIDTGGIYIDQTKPTAQFILDQYPGNTRTFHADRGAAIDIHADIVPPSYYQAQYIHLSTGLPSAHLAWIEILHNAQSTSTLSSDPFETFVINYPDETQHVIQMSHMLFINEEEVKLLGQFGENISIPTIIKRGTKGVVYKYGDCRIEVPAPLVTAVETTGAGDVLAGAFLGLRSAGHSLEESLEKAVRIASFSVTQFGVEHLL